MTMPEPNRSMEQAFMRQRKIYDPELMNEHVTVVGCGSLGSWAAVCLSKLGLNTFTFYDADSVEQHNLPNQVFSHDTMSQNKAEMLSRYVDAFMPFYDSEKTVLEVKNRHWEDTDVLAPGVILNAADSILVRKMVYEKAPEESFIIDVRSSGDSFNVYTCDKRKPEDRAFYEQFFFKPEDAAGTDCNAQAIAYSSMVIGALATDAFVRYARMEEYPLSVEGDLSAFDIFPTFRRDIKAAPVEAVAAVEAVTPEDPKPEPAVEPVVAEQTA